MAASQFGTITDGNHVVVTLDQNYTGFTVLHRGGAGELWIKADPEDENNITPEAAGLEVIPAVGFVEVESDSQANPTKVTLRADGADIKYGVIPND